MAFVGWRIRQIVHRSERIRVLQSKNTALDVERLALQLLRVGIRPSCLRVAARLFIIIVHHYRRLLIVRFEDPPLDVEPLPVQFFGLRVVAFAIQNPGQVADEGRPAPHAVHTLRVSLQRRPTV
jgi:hypothetical protein